MLLHRKKIIFRTEFSLHNQIHDIISPKYLTTQREKNLKFPKKRLLQMKRDTYNPLAIIHLKGWTRHFEHEYIIKLSKKGSCPPSVESNAEIRS